jgi:hypothetical protein
MLMAKKPFGAEAAPDHLFPSHADRCHVGLARLIFTRACVSRFRQKESRGVGGALDYTWRLVAQAFTSRLSRCPVTLTQLLLKVPPAIILAIYPASVMPRYGPTARTAACNTA